MTELPARDVRSTILYPELGKHTVDSLIPMVTDHQEAWGCQPQSDNLLTTLAVSSTNDFSPQKLKTRPDSAHDALHSACEVQIPETNEPKWAILAQVNAAMARNCTLRGSTSSVWVNDNALLKLGNGMHQVRYETKRTVFAVRKKKPHHTNGCSSTSRHSARQL